jgi:hypothetical protein
MPGAKVIRGLKALVAGILLCSNGWGQTVAEPTTNAVGPRVAAIVTVYHHNSHADVIVGRLLQGYSLDGMGEYPRMKLASLYVDQFPAGDKSRTLAQQHGFRLSSTIEDALTLGTGKLAVDGVLLIAEHGNYPENSAGSFDFPKRRFFDEAARVMRMSGRGTPIFFDKHLAQDWNDAQAIVTESQRLNAPLLAGSSLPLTWRLPPVEAPREANLRELVVVSHHRLDSYGFHALEAAQCLVERRRGGETGVAAVRCVEGGEVWELGDRGVYDKRLVAAALSRLKERPLPPGKRIEELVPRPQLFLVEYRDGLRVAVLTLNQAVVEWAAAWRYDNQQTESTLFWTHELRPFGHFSFLTREIDQFMTTRKAPWPLERTLLTTGLLESLLISRKEGGKRIETPHLRIVYQSTGDWTNPPPPPPGRPIEGP